MQQSDGRNLQVDLAMDAVTSASGRGVYASADKLFKGAVFGRDSLEVAEDLIDVRPELVGRIILTLASLQGMEPSDANEEERGKVVHEYRTALVDGQPLDDTSQKIFDRLSDMWGGNDKQLAYYGSIDATPHFIRVIAAYCERMGENFLDEEVEGRNNHRLSVKAALKASTDWLVDKLANSRTGMLEYQRRNPSGIANQVWKDSVEFYIHEDGTLANHDQPIASIEVQGLAYDALKAAAKLLPSRADELKVMAAGLQSKTIDTLWLPEKQYFALGVDHDEHGQPRLLKTKTANPAALLDTTIFDSLPAEEKRQYIEAIVTTIVGPDFLTDAGIRSRALSQADLVNIWDYHGSYVTWPKETYDIAKGLRRQGYAELSRQLENRLLNASHRINGFPEFYYVDRDGRILFREIEDPKEVFTIDVTNDPEGPQAWTVSALMAIMADRAHGTLEEPVQTAEQMEFEASLLLSMPLQDELRTRQALEVYYPAYSYRHRNETAHDAGDPLVGLQ